MKNIQEFKIETRPKCTDYVEDKETSEFYPTPAAIARRMIDKVDWKYVKAILEPSAGKGDILCELAKRLRHNYEIYNNGFETDCIEIDANLRAILKHRFSDEARQELEDTRDALIKQYGTYTEQDYQTKRYSYLDSSSRKMKEFPDEVQAQLAAMDEADDTFFPNGIHIVHDDFLTYTNYKKYQAIIMNPPFANGDKHLLKALEMQKDGGQIVCILNAETIRNPYTETRKHLVSLLNMYDADIEYIKNAFHDAERKTDVEIALIYVNIPYTVEGESLFERIAKTKEYKEPAKENTTELEVTDLIQMLINRYKIEIESGIELIRTYERMAPYLNSELSPEKQNSYGSPLIVLCGAGNNRITVNQYVRSVRFKYWKALLSNDKFTSRLTSRLQNEYAHRISDYADYDFSEFNIHVLLAEMNAQIQSGVKAEIETMYDKLTEEHSYFPECTKNRHLYNGWKTNKAWKIDKKCIIPCYGIFDSWDGRPRTYEAYNLLSDIERILNFFDGNTTAEIDLSSQIQIYFNAGITKNVHCKFFDVTFYKKGTVHITFHCPELIDRFNIYAARHREWLPPCYGKKHYSDMTADEKAVIDGFQGKEEYEKVLSKADYYLAPPVVNNNRDTHLLVG